MLFQASCVAIGDRAVLVTGAPGSGKSSLALALIDRGANLIGDDGVSLSVAAGRLIASPAPATIGLLEVRNVGLLSFSPVSAIPVALLLQLDPEAPRFIEAAAQSEFLGVTIPTLALWPDSPVLHLRAEQALKRYGLP